MLPRPSLTVPYAAGVPGFTGSASMNEIQNRFRELAKEWHPDTSNHDADVSHETFIRILQANEVLVDYCMNYGISFRP
jgi:DnaJ-class molecular chaperone